VHSGILKALIQKIIHKNVGKIYPKLPTFLCLRVKFKYVKMFINSNLDKNMPIRGAFFGKLKWRNLAL
jgi:hypothetical protein